MNYREQTILKEAKATIIHGHGLKEVKTTANRSGRLLSLLFDSHLHARVHVVFTLITITIICV
jgi:hypothetical protein